MIAACLCAFASSIGISADTKAEKSDPALDRVLQRLGDEDFTVRDKAARDLREASARALPTPRKAADHSDPEIRRQAKELLAEIETTVLLSPKHVTLKAVNKPLQE